MGFGSGGFGSSSFGAGGDTVLVDLADTLSLTEGLTTGLDYTVSLSELFMIVEGLGSALMLEETVITVESVDLAGSYLVGPAEILTIVENATAPVTKLVDVYEAHTIADTLQFSLDGSSSSVLGLPESFPLDQALDPDNYSIEGGSGVPSVTVLGVDPVYTTLQTGGMGQVLASVGSFSSVQFDTYTGFFTEDSIGDFISVTNSTLNENKELLIVDADGPVVTLQVPLGAHEPLNGTYIEGSGFVAGTGQLQWEHKHQLNQVVLRTNETLGGQSYVVQNDLIPGFTWGYVSTTAQPAIESVTFNAEDGSLSVVFSKPMRPDEALTSPGEYSFSGPSGAEVRQVLIDSPTKITLVTAGFQDGSYTLTINATGTPKDVAGNPIDPTFNQAIFTASVPLLSRSIFVDKGPLARPELTLASGTGGTIQTTVSSFFGTVTLNEVVLPGASFTASHVGNYIELGNTSVNAGNFRIASVISSTRVSLEANLRLPDVDNGSLTWRLYDPRTGEIADDPSDVTVSVNGSPVTPDAVIGLLGQIVLPTAPIESDDVQVSYSWIPNPTVELRRLNSKEFKLNGWNQDSGLNPTQHAYRLRNTLVSPSSFVANDISAEQSQPLLRDLHYRAYERAYTATLNDPDLLLLNTPIHRIAYPPLSRTIAEESVSYTADVLPEVDSSPWDRKGIGSASASGELVVEDNTDGPYPSGNPLFWTRSVDVTFPHVFAYNFRMRIDSSTPVGVFTGIAAGWSDDNVAFVLGFLLDGTTWKVGVLRRAAGNLVDEVSSWTGGLGTLVGQPVDLDWSISHSYRVLRDLDGVTRVYVDGGVTEILSVTPSELPFLSELNAPFDEIQGVYFGSLSREAVNVSTWDFVRYTVLPTNPQQSEPSIYVSYEGDVLPENASKLWTPVGYHGNESLSSSLLIVDSTSAVGTTDAGLVGGDYHGFTRIEPLLRTSSDVVLDFDVRLRTYTHGITPNAVMASVDDGDRLVQVSFFPTKSQPKVSYPGRALPNESAVPWTALGTQTAAMQGQTLVITDSSVGDGLVYAIEDLEPGTSDNRIVAAGLDYYIEFKFSVTSYTADGTSESFAGATVDVFDGTRAIGVMTRESAGAKKLAFHSDGLLFGASSEFDFDWSVGTNVVRLVKSTTGDLVSLFVNGSLLGTFPYTSFNLAVGNPTMSFGSSTAVSASALSVVNWHYVNIWRGQPASGVRKYVGLWKGTDTASLLDYHLPLAASGSASVAGNALTDLTADFVSAGISIGDDLVIDTGANQGVYSIASVSTNSLTITGVFPSTPSEVSYRVPSEIDWTVSHKYRIVRDPGGAVSLLLDSASDPVIRVSYGPLDLPASFLGFPSQISNRLPSVTWGSFDPHNLSQTAWDFVRYGIVNSVANTQDRIVPHHHLLNQRNVMASPEHLTTTVVHDHTQYSSASTGVPHPWHDFVENSAVTAFTRLNEGTPLVPSTQTYEIRNPQPQQFFLSALNRPEDVLNNAGDFLLNDGATEVRIVVPNDVLYSCLEVVEDSEGASVSISPVCDDFNPISLGTLYWQQEVCGTYAGDDLPELDGGFGTTWTIESDDPGFVTATAFSGALTYSVGASTGNTIYRNPTPLTDPIGLTTTVSFRLRVLNDSTGGTGDTGIRFGFSAFGTITAAIAFVTSPYGVREVRLLDLATENIVGAIQFDFLDGNYHVYQLVKNVKDGTVDFLIDP